jgi:hypothetical protein
MRAGHSARSLLQDGRFDATESITVCAVNTDPAEAPLFRVPATASMLDVSMLNPFKLEMRYFSAF